MTMCLQWHLPTVCVNPNKLITFAQLFRVVCASTKVNYFPEVAPPPQMYQHTYEHVLRPLR